MARQEGPPSTLGADLLYNRLVISPHEIPRWTLPLDKVEDVDPSEYIDALLDTCGPSLHEQMLRRTAGEDETIGLPSDFTFYANAFAAAQEQVAHQPFDFERRSRLAAHLPVARDILVSQQLNEARGWLKLGWTPSIAARLILLNAAHPFYAPLPGGHIEPLWRPSGLWAATEARQSRLAIRAYVNSRLDPERHQIAHTMDDNVLYAILEAELFKYWVKRATPPEVQLARAQRVRASIRQVIFGRKRLPDIVNEVHKEAKEIIRANRS